LPPPAVPLPSCPPPRTFTLSAATEIDPALPSSNASTVTSEPSTVNDPASSATPPRESAVPRLRETTIEPFCTTISPPRIALVGAVTQTDGDRVHISGTATDEEAVRDVYISVYNPARNLFGSAEKVFYQAASDPKTGRLEFAADIPLTPGNNIIEIRARENDDVAATKQMWVLRTSGLKEARAAQGKFTSNGKLSVDTLSK